MKQPTGYLKTAGYIFLQDDDQNDCGILERQKFERWLENETDELIWANTNGVGRTTYVKADLADFWGNYPLDRQLARLLEFRDMTEPDEVENGHYEREDNDRWLENTSEMDLWNYENNW